MKCAAWICAWLALAAGARAAIIDTSMVIDAEHSFSGEAIEVVDGTNPPTVVDLVEGGIVGALQISPDIVGRGQSQINLRGGEVRPANYGAVAMYDSSKLRIITKYDFVSVRAADSSTVEITASGSADAVDALDQSSVRVVDGWISSAGARGNAQLKLINANAQSERFGVVADERSEVRIIDRVDDLEWVHARDDSTLWIDGGAIRLLAEDNAAVHWTSGRFKGGILVSDNATLHVYGYNLRFTRGEDQFDTQVVGLSRHGSSFGSSYRLRDNGRIVLHELPEPSTIALGGVALMALVCARRFSAKQ